jgi:hypothetical protein
MLFYKALKAAIVILMTIICTGARAESYTATFSVSSFQTAVGPVTPAPFTPISGSITFSAESLMASIDSVDQIQLSIGPYTYTLAEITYGGNGTNATPYYFRSITNNVAGAQAFLFMFSTQNPPTSLFSYSVPGASSYWFANNFPVTVTAVPETSTSMLLLAGLLVLMRTRATRLGSQARGQAQW